MEFQEKEYDLKKTCHIKDANTISQKEIRELYSDGFRWFYFKQNQRSSAAVRALKALASFDEEIKIFVVHPAKSYYWREEEITNLPIALSDDPLVDDKSLVEAYLVKYCDFVHEK